MKVGIITQARTGSKRLPNKVLFSINEKTILDYHLDRLVNNDISTYLATTTHKEDDKISELGKTHKVQVYRGSQDDVLERFYQCASTHKLDIVIRVTADCPLIDINEIVQGLKTYKEIYTEHRRTYLSNTVKRTFPKGMDFEIFSSALLEEAYYNTAETYEREHVTPYFYNNRKNDINCVNYLNTKDTSNLRVTLDYEEDFIFLKELIVIHQAHLKSLHEIEDLIQQTDRLTIINEQCKQVAQIENSY